MMPRLELSTNSTSLPTRGAPPSSALTRAMAGPGARPERYTMLKDSRTWRRPAASTHADDIPGHGPRGDAVGDDEGGHVLGDFGEAADVGVGPDPHERMQAG